MAEETAFSQLTAKQKRMVTLFTSEGKRDTYLNRYASYTACYSSKGKRQGIEANAYRLFKKQAIQSAIKELMPPLAYDHFFVSNEYMEHYENAKKEDERKDCLDILKEMARHTGMLDKKKDVVDAKEATKFETQAKEAQEQWNEQLEKMNKDKAG